MNAFEQLLQWDSQLLLWINAHHSPFWDQVMWYASQAWIWIPLYLLFIWVIYRLVQAGNYSPPNLGVPEGGGSVCVSKTLLLLFLSIACIALAAGLSDFVTSGLLKKTICRPRPTHSQIAGLLHLVNGYTGGHYGFPSSHAANTVAVTTSFLMIFSTLKRHTAPTVSSDGHMVTLQLSEKLLKTLGVLYVLLNCYSRMYLGVHYPLDILCGALMGLLLGCLPGLIFRHILSRPS